MLCRASAIRLYGYSAMQVFGYTGFQLYGYSANGYTAFRLHGLSIHPFGYLVMRLLCCLAFRLSSYSASRLYKRSAMRRNLVEIE